VHIALSDADQDLSNLLLLRSSVPFFVLSRTPSDAYRNALLLSKLSRVGMKAAVHVLYDKEAVIPPLTDDEARSFLWFDTAKVNGTDVKSDRYRWITLLGLLRGSRGDVAGVRLGWTAETVRSEGGVDFSR
jgi:sulfite reductase (NADPH) hemoprotein beta-component